MFKHKRCVLSFEFVLYRLAQFQLRRRSSFTTEEYPAEDKFRNEGRKNAINRFLNLKDHKTARDYGKKKQKSFRIRALIIIYFIVHYYPAPTTLTTIVYDANIVRRLCAPHSHISDKCFNQLEW